MHRGWGHREHHGWRGEDGPEEDFDEPIWVELMQVPPGTTEEELRALFQGRNIEQVEMQPQAQAAAVLFASQDDTRAVLNGQRELPFKGGAVAICVEEQDEPEERQPRRGRGRQWGGRR